MGKFVIFVPILLMQGKYFTEASTGGANASSPNSISSHQTSGEEDRLYYLPTQTVFTKTVAGGLSTTSPPHLTIHPDPPIEMAHPGSTVLQQEGGKHDSLEMSQCVSETPIMELESRFLLPSKSVIREMSGHLEIPSKTQEGGLTPEIPSGPSVTTADL